MKKNFKLSFKQLLLVGIVALTGLQAPTSAYAMSNATQQIIQSEQPSTPNYQQKNDFKLYINGERKTLSNGFLVVNGRTFLPVRELSGLLGISDNNIGWDSENRVASVSQDNTLIEIPIGYTQASVNNEIKDIDTADTSASPTRSVIANGYTYLPVRFISENLGWQIDTQGKTIHLYNVSPMPQITEQVSNTGTQLHKFFKERGGVILEGAMPKSGNYGDAVDLNGDGKIGGSDVERYNRITEMGQQEAMDGEFRNWFKSQNPPPKTNGTTTGQESQDKLYTWDGLNQSWEFTPFGSDSFKSEWLEFKAAQDEMAITSTGPIFG